MKHTIEQRLIAGLTAFGWREVPAKSKYRTFTHSKQPSLLFVGGAGALRAGRCASASHSVGAPGQFQSSFYKNVLAKGDEVLDPTSALKNLLA